MFWDATQTLLYDKHTHRVRPQTWKDGAAMRKRKRKSRKCIITNCTNACKWSQIIITNSKKGSLLVCCVDRVSIDGMHCLYYGSHFGELIEKVLLGFVENYLPFLMMAYVILCKTDSLWIFFMLLFFVGFFQYISTTTWIFRKFYESSKL